MLTVRGAIETLAIDPSSLNIVAKSEEDEKGMILTGITPHLQGTRARRGEWVRAASQGRDPHAAEHRATRRRGHARRRRAELGPTERWSARAARRAATSIRRRARPERVCKAGSSPAGHREWPPGFCGHKQPRPSHTHERSLARSGPMRFTPHHARASTTGDRRERDPTHRAALARADPAHFLRWLLGQGSDGPKRGGAHRARSSELHRVDRRSSALLAPDASSAEPGCAFWTQQQEVVSRPSGLLDPTRGM